MWTTLLGGLIKPVTDIIDKSITDKDEAARLKHEVTMAVMVQGSAELDAQKSIILAEASGDGIKAQWRPILMLTIVAIVANNYLVAPYINAIFGAATAPILDLPEHLWNLMNLGLGGYVVGRSAEKIADSIRK